MNRRTERFFTENAAQRSARVLAMKLPGTNPTHRLLLVGAGMIGREHIRVAHLLGRATVTAIVDPDKGSLAAADALCRELGVTPPAQYDALEAALAAADYDAIFVCTPNYTHYRIVEQLTSTGKPLFIEKPMATTLAEAGRMVQMAATYPAIIQLGMQYRYKSQYTEAFHQALQHNALGCLKTISMCEYRPPFLDKVKQWNKFNEYSGGTLVEKCCHYFDLINQLAGSRPLSVYASGGQAVAFRNFEYEGRRSDIDDHAFVIINYENGLRANFTLNMFCEELYEELIVTGERGRLVATEESSFKHAGSSVGRIKVEVEAHPDYTFRDLTYPAVIERSGHHGATFFEHEAFCNQLEGKPMDAATPLQGMWAMIVASAAQQAMAEQRLISITSFLEQHGLAWLPEA